MKIFFDTEFTGLHKNTTLISLGMIDENGRTFYAEFSDYYEVQCDEWIYNNVIKNLKWSKDGPIENFMNKSIDFKTTEVFGTKQYIKDCLSEWLSSYNYVELVSDCCHYDMVLFIDIFGGAFDIPKQICPACYDINQDIAKYYHLNQFEAFDMSRENIWHRLVEERSPGADLHLNETSKHNALFDAKVIKDIYEMMRKLDNRI